MGGAWQNLHDTYGTLMKNHTSKCFGKSCSYDNQQVKPRKWITCTRVLNLTDPEEDSMTELHFEVWHIC